MTRRVASVLVVLFGLLPAAGYAARDLARSVKDAERSMAGYVAVRKGWIAAGNAVSRCDSAAGAGIARLSQDYARIANYLSSHSKAGERILVALDRHDKIFINPVSLYFASSRLPGTHWHQFDPGLQTRADIQSAIIDDLRRNGVNWVIRDKSFDAVAEPNDSAKSSGVFVLDQYLEENYRPVAASGKVQAWLRNERMPEPSRAECEAISVSSAFGVQKERG